MIDNPEKDFRLVSSNSKLNQEALAFYQSLYYTENNGLLGGNSKIKLVGNRFYPCKNLS